MAPGITAGGGGLMKFQLPAMESQRAHGMTRPKMWKLWVSYVGSLCFSAVLRLHKCPIGGGEAG